MHQTVSFRAGNTTDRGTRRYRYGQQPMVAQWNLARLAGAFLPIIGDTTMLEAVMRFL